MLCVLCGFVPGASGLGLRGPSSARAACKRRNQKRWPRLFKAPPASVLTSLRCWAPGCSGVEAWLWPKLKTRRKSGLPWCLRWPRHPKHFATPATGARKLPHALLSDVSNPLRNLQPPLGCPHPAHTNALSDMCQVQGSEIPYSTLESL